ncbi:nitrate- and nitrite sensing domain-containing protein [Dactylosporangium sp. NPDC000244]|uniref:sensor histidine kinase n=1 Tax=Dactylosporangium sp. NPDC000244 TaxID=3154365 RepID=UPI00331EF7CD
MTQSQSSLPVPAQRQGRDPRQSPERRPTRHTAALARREEPLPPGRAPEARSGQRAGRRIVDQLRLIVALPLVAVVVFAGVAFIATVQEVNRARTLQDLSALSTDAGGLAHALQRERAAAVNVVLHNEATQQDAFQQQSMLTDDAVRKYNDQRHNLAGGGDSETLKRIDADLGALAKLRDQVRNDKRASVSAVAFSYRITIADLLEYRESVARSGAPTDLADEIRAAAALSRAAEAIGQQQAAVLRAIAAGELTPALQQEITATRTSFTEQSVAFTQLAPAEWRTWYEQAGMGDQVVAAQRLQDQVGRTAPGQRIGFESAAWINAMSGYEGLLYQVEQQVDENIEQAVTVVHDDQMTRAALQTAGVVVVLLVAIVLTGFVARRLTRRLRYLQDAARTVAYDQLPSVVAELRAAAPGTVDPDEVADRASSTLVVAGSDEVADVAQAFRAVHREAVKIAGEQAVMRSNVAEIFVHLSRREQRLVDAVLAQVDKVERDETDPDRLQELYQLDHLATRMARINLSLLVLGGSGAARVRREDAPLGKVLQAAISQIEHYVRVRFGSVDDDVAVVAEAVDEIVHLLAELLDNATGYSPPESEVWVTASGLGDRVIVQIVDVGVGLSPARREQLNQLLAQPPAIDIAAVRAMGLTVVGHIAARYNITVALRPGQHTGTLAEIVIPKDVFRPIMASERGPQLAPATVGAPDHNGNGSRPGNDLFTPQARPSEPSLFEVPAQQWATQELTPIQSSATTQVFTAPDYDKPLPDAQPYQNGQSYQDTHSYQDAQSYQDTQYQDAAPYQAPAYPPPPAHAQPAPPGPGMWPPLPEPEVSSILASAEDDAMELPIFNSVSGWFHVETPPGLEPEPVGAMAGASAAASAGTSAPAPQPQASAPEPKNWESAADAGWRAAAEAATPQVSSTTAAGLPVRAAGRQLVPGAAEPTQQRPGAPMQTGTPKRDPSRVAAAMSAYARGVANRRPQS